MSRFMSKTANSSRIQLLLAEFRNQGRTANAGLPGCSETRRWLQSPNDKAEGVIAICVFITVQMLKGRIPSELDGSFLILDVRRATAAP